VLEIENVIIIIIIIIIIITTATTSAGKSNQLEYLVKSTSNWPKSYSVTK